MDYYSRRRRNRRALPVQVERKSCLLSGISTFLVMSTLVVITYFMLEYHCQTCKRNDLYNVTRNINDLAQNICYMKNSYNDLEEKILKFSHDLPKIEGQIEVLESLASFVSKPDSMNKGTQHFEETNNLRQFHYANITNLNNKHED